MKKIQILGTGCAKCRKLSENARTAADQLGIDYELEKVTDISEITSFGILSMPGLAIDGEIVSAGKLLKPEQIVKLLA